MIRGNRRLKTLYSFKCLIMYSRISLNKEFDLEKSGNFSQLDLWQPCSIALWCNFTTKKNWLFTSEGVIMKMSLANTDLY